MLAPIDPSGKIPRVTGGRRVVLVILLYITLDLSIAAMPGAFVFEAGDSVESTQLSRGRQLLEIGLVLIPPRDSKSVVVEEVPVRLSSVPRPLPPMLLYRGERSRAATPDSPALSEDSH